MAATGLGVGADEDDLDWTLRSGLDGGPHAGPSISIAPSMVAPIGLANAAGCGGGAFEGICTGAARGGVGDCCCDSTKGGGGWCCGCIVDVCEE